MGAPRPSIIQAPGHVTHLNVNLTVLTPEALRAVADVTIHIIFASSAVLTRIRGVLVNIDLAAEPREARGTRAVVVGDPVETRASIQTRAVPALVPVSLTVVSRVAVLTE